MKKRRLLAPEYREDYLLNTVEFVPERQAISLHSFCHSLLMPSFRDRRSTAMPYILVSLVLSGKELFTDPDGDQGVREAGYFSISDLNQLTPSRFKNNLHLERYFVLIRVNRFLRELLDSLFPNGLPKGQAPDPVRLKRCFEDIRRVLRRQGETDGVLLGAMAFRLLSEAADQFSIRTGLPEPLSRALQYIDNQFCNPALTRMDTARAAGISAVSLGKLFRENLHKTVNHHILELRLERGKRLLAQTGLSVGEIARQCGFTYPYYFCRVFREHFGCTALAFRQERRK